MRRRDSRSACDHIGAVLHARAHCWRTDAPAGEGPVLLPDGTIMGYLPTLNPDGAKLPDRLELPARADHRQLGRFVLDPDDVVVSAEERFTAASMVTLFARTAAHLG